MTERRLDTDVRARLLESAARLLAQDGPSGMSTRKVAAQAGTSTMALYSQFGSMPELVRAIVDEGFTRLREQIDRIPQTSDPVADLGAIFAAWLDNARDNPDLYVVMFGATALGGYRRSGDDLQQGRYAFDALASGADRAISAGRFNPGEPVAIASRLWSALHGYVMLEIVGYFDPPNSGVKYVLQPMLVDLVIGLGDQRARAQASATSWFAEAATVDSA
ncbi:TetR/AcrR family transcriptional regulator [Antrihabitans cavernicola]|uniref:TetR/AcrR family transcriptional regulator n=1 Tax=Antrihabitans cavernicola TaxID=2495913 RepID=UPI0016592DD2|nr:TetR/AcrR family transcriptional regulator [Spelaeibacter cavernicola]